MREVLKSDGSKALTMEDEPKVKRPGPGMITTENVKPLTREERAARQAAEALRAANAAKIEVEKKGGSK